jgi:uncharacterized protein YndB with AHSA1/START domain
MSSPTDRIERKILIAATRERVWRALTDLGEFNRWFGVQLEGKAFAARTHFKGRVTYPGYEHLMFEVTIERCEPPGFLSWRWHPAALDASVDYSSEPTTLVEFELREAGGGTVLTVVESGIERIPLPRRLDVFRLNTEGWDEQMLNIEKHICS